MWICVCLLQQQMETSRPCLGWVKYLCPPSPLCSLLLFLALSSLSVSVLRSLSVSVSLCVSLSHSLSLSPPTTTWLQSLGQIACLCVYLFSFLKAETICKLGEENISMFFHRNNLFYFSPFSLCRRCVWQLFPFTEREGLVCWHSHCRNCRHQRRKVLLYTSDRPSCKIYHCL